MNRERPTYGVRREEAPPRRPGSITDRAVKKILARGRPPRDERPPRHIDKDE